LEFACQFVHSHRLVSLQHQNLSNTLSRISSFQAPGPGRRSPVNEARHAATLAVATIGEKPVRLSVSAEIAAKNLGNARIRQVLPGQRVQIRLPAPTLIFDETVSRSSIISKKFIPDFTTNLECRL
jgi:hypothetical protein